MTMVTGSSTQTDRVSGPLVTRTGSLQVSVAPVGQVKASAVMRRRETTLSVRCCGNALSGSPNFNVASVRF